MIIIHDFKYGNPLLYLKKKFTIYKYNIIICLKNQAFSGNPYNGRIVLGKLVLNLEISAG